MIPAAFKGHRKSFSLGCNDRLIKHEYNSGIIIHQESSESIPYLYYIQGYGCKFYQNYLQTHHVIIYQILIIILLLDLKRQSVLTNIITLFAY